MRVASTSNDFAYLNELAGYDVSLIADEDWQQKVDILLKLMIAHVDEVLGLEVPSTMGSIHRDFSKMALEIQTFAVLYAKGIDDSDVVAVEAALFHMGEVHSWADEATRQRKTRSRATSVLPHAWSNTGKRQPVEVAERPPP